MRKFLSLTLTVLWIATGGRGLAGTPPPEVAELLERVAACSGRFNYEGVVSLQYVRGDTLLNIKNYMIFHAPDKTWIQGLAPQSRAGRIICRRGPEMYLRDRDEAIFRREETNPRHNAYAGGYQPVELLRRNYDVKLVRSEEMLGRPVAVVEAVPRKGRTTWIRGWVDGRTGLVLRLEKFDCDNHLKSALQFETLQIDAPADPRLFDITVAEKTDTDRTFQFFSSLQTLELAFGAPLMRPRILPDGYVLRELKLIRREGRTIPKLVYYNGISSLSLFQRAGDKDQPRALATAEMGLSEREGTVTVRRYGNDYALILVGDLSRQEMVRIFESVGYLNEPLP